MKTIQLERLKKEIIKMKGAVVNKQKPPVMNAAQKKSFENIVEAELAVLRHLYECIQSMEQE